MHLHSKMTRIPYGPLGIVSLASSMEMGQKVNKYLVEWRGEYIDKDERYLTFPGYQRDTFQISNNCYRFSIGEGKAVINESVRGYDLYILADIGNYSCKFKMFGMECPMSPDDHFQDIKRVISAIGGKAKRITVIMPMLYQSRQDKRIARESLDCAIALQELERLGVDNIITFDAHEPRVQNAIPLKGFENIYPTYQFIKAILNSEEKLTINKQKMIVVSPDEGAINRNMYYSSIMGLDLALYYKRRDYSRVVNGRNPIVKHEFLGDSVEGKDVLIVDDILSTGESVIDIVKDLKQRKANNVYVAVTFALFTNGIDQFQECYEKGLITKLFATNLTYRRKELLNAPWYVDVNMSKFIAYLIDTLNHDESISSLLNPSEKIKGLLDKHQ